ncbi:unnamed protein product [Hyaloperonospora brassicae]|uniref:RING-type domain-containing protein n=1 Tax=Hyaloperonospora brassicae TaxID=162125 RepID=A0AAV0U4G4_HYABA|nr:unnamed protein product [Hyaloperonospora brassicae]
MELSTAFAPRAHSTRRPHRRRATSTSTSSLSSSSSSSVKSLHRKSSRHSSSSRVASTTSTANSTSADALVHRTTATSAGSTVPVTIEFLEHVSLELSVTKNRTDVRYVMTVRHRELDVLWRHARSFDEYRKLQQRLVKRLQHGHFCTADCPWLSGFLKSYFPKKWVPTFASGRAGVIHQRRQSLERFFAVLFGFVTDRQNLGCAIVVTAFADELVRFVYGDALQQYGLQYAPVQWTKRDRGWAHVYGAKLKETATSVKQHFRGRGAAEQQQQEEEHHHQQQQQQQAKQSVRRSLPTSSSRDLGAAFDVVTELDECDDCTICGLRLCGNAASEDLPLMPRSNLTALLLEEDEAVNGSVDEIIDSSRSTACCTDTGGWLQSRANRNSNTSTSGVFTPSWQGMGTPSGSSTACAVGGYRPNQSSVNRRRAATYYLTTLNCGHQFHDECIVAKLNEALVCPTCGRAQTNA